MERVHTGRPEGAHPWSATRWALVLGVALAVAYLRWSPAAPDLAAQVARSSVVRESGVVSWWTGWFGGVSLPTYSVLAPASMAAIGVRASGALAAVAGAVGASVLLRDAPRPRAGAVAFAVAFAADLVAGRVTFAIGLAVATWALVALRARLGWVAAALSVAAYLASPLAGLFLGLVLLAVVAVDRTRRAAAAVSAGCLVAVGGTMALLFPGTGVMPFTVVNAIPPAVCCVVVALVCRVRLVRAAALAVLISLPVFLLVPGAVGGNIGRLAWVGAGPVLVACSRLSWRRTLALLLVVVAWPVSDLAHQLFASSNPSAAQAFYEPLRAELHAVQAAAGMPARGERVEVVDTVNHWASAYLSGSVSLARGWDRQVDVADNPLFYTDGALTPESYRGWLGQLAVGWVALPDGKLDFASADEGRLVAAGLPYLRLVWSDRNWQLFQVVDATPLANGATVTAVTPSSVTLATTAAGTVRLRLRWSSYLTVVRPGTREQLLACVSDDGGWTRIDVPRAESFSVVSQFNPTARLRRSDPDCPSDVAIATTG